MKDHLRPKARAQLDGRLSPLKPADRWRAPPKGWIRAIRDSLGMSGPQLASRLAIRPQTVEAFEKSETAGTIQLNTLRRAAEALDCVLVYALVPKTSLDQTVSQRARKIARRRIEQVDHTMRLEDQGTDNSNLDAKIDAYVRDMLKDRDLWNEQ